MLEAVYNPGVWDKDSTYFFCKAFEPPYPFVKAKTLGEYYDGLPPDEADQPIETCELSPALSPLVNASILALKLVQQQPPCRLLTTLPLGS